MAMQKTRHVTERGKRVPVVSDVDVVVAGAGISGMFAALAAARMGAKTLLIDRFGSLGGNLGPGMIWGGGPYNEADKTLPGGMTGIPKEFVERMEAMMRDLPRNYASFSSVISYLASKMMDEAKVKLILSAYVADPIVRNGKVEGLFVETVSGRVAVKAKVTVDATGEGVLAARAGAPMIRVTPPKPSFEPIVRPTYLDKRFKVYDDGGLYALIAGCDFAQYQEFAKQKIEATDELKQWIKDHRFEWFGYPWVIAGRQALENGDYKLIQELAPKIWLWSVPHVQVIAGEVGAIQGQAFGSFQHDDWRDVTKLEKLVRDAMYDFVLFLRKYIPGMQKAHLLFIAPFQGTRGGPHIDAERTLTIEESIKGVRFDDVIFVNIHEGLHGGAKEGYDVPYRMLLPKGLDGLLVTGRGAGYVRRGHDPSGLRARPSMMILGQATGVAAALAAKGNTTPRKLDPKRLQKTLLTQGIVLGDKARLGQLGIV